MNTTLFYKGILVASFIFLAGNAIAQTTVNSVKGMVIDNNGDALWGATVTIIHQGDSTKKRMAIVNENGNFTVDSIARGFNRITITNIGYNNYTKTINIEGDTNLGTIYMQESAEMLDGITVMAEYTKLAPSGETIIQVKGNPLAKGKSLMDFLKFSRDINVTENSISVRGKSNTKIYLDDQEISFNELKAIPPSMIARIEVIPEANASYGRGATGGIVKVVLRNDAGLIGSITGRGGYTSKDDFFGDGNASLLYSSGKLTISNFLNGGVYDDIFENVQDTYDANGESNTRSKEDVSKKNLMDNLSLRYKFNKTDQLDVYGGTTLSNRNAKNNSATTADYITNTLFSTTNSKTRNYSAGMVLKKGLDTNGSNYLQLRVNYFKNKDVTGLGYTYNGFSEPAEQNTDMDLVSVRPYISLKPGDKINITGGIDYQYVIDRHKEDGTPTLGYIDDGHFNVLGNDIGAWAEAGFNINKYLYIRGALNYHSTNFKYKDYHTPENNINRWQNGIYPTIFGQWLINAKKQRALQISYRHDYSIPNYNYLLPTVSWQGENRYSIGNPDLVNEKYDFVDVTFLLNSSWSVSYGFTYGSNMVNVIMRQDPSHPDIYYTYPENTGSTRYHYLRLNYSGRLFKFWYTSNTLNGNYTNENVNNNKYHNAALSLSSYNDFSINKNIGIMLNLYVASKSRNASYRNNAIYNLGVGAYASLLKDKLRVDLRYINILYNQNKIMMEGEGWHASRKTLSQQRHIRLSLTWNFDAGRKIKNEQLPKGMNDAGRQIPTF